MPSNTGGHKRKFSIIKGAQTKLGGMKKNLKDPKILSMKKKKQFDDVQNHMKKTKTKRTSPCPTQRGMIDNFGKTFK